ncbi:hypothetical protein Tco_0923626 [Tanacetum coccineum]|uniref:Uncharacterized protein n=1 Tax=Tanacetum coccineum TaxID=301880 RepID=A0ABQ5D2N8_9ASTR
MGPSSSATTGYNPEDLTPSHIRSDLNALHRRVPPTTPVVPIVHNDPRDQYVAARDATPVPATDDDDTAAAKDSQPSESRGSLRDPTMPPKRRSQTNPPPLLTQEAVNQLVRDGIEATIRAERERVREEATRAGGLAEEDSGCASS